MLISMSGGSSGALGRGVIVAMGAIIVQTIWAATSGTTGENQYGANPLEEMVAVDDK